MPTTTTTFTFSGGANPVAGYGDRWKIGFGGTWAFNDYWTIDIASTEGDYTLGVGNLHALTPTVCFTYRDREYLGLSSQFNFSDNGDPTAWEVQNPGAGFIDFLSQYGGQDAIAAFSQLQGRLAVLGRRSVQIWIVDADPNQFSLVQTLDNLGTRFPLSAFNLGDLDVIFLDDTGFRSLRSRETTLNAYADDIGAPVDSLVQEDLEEIGTGTAVAGVVEPTTKNYWCYLNEKIYVLSRHIASKISAWSTYLPTNQTLTDQGMRVDVSGTNSVFTGLLNDTLYYFTKAGSATLNQGVETYTESGYIVTTTTNAAITGAGATASLLQQVTQETFTPQKFVILNGRVYCRSVEQGLLLYGGSTNTVYDNSVVTAITPYLDDKSPATNKFGQGIDFALAGKWTISAGLDPVSGAMTQIIAYGSASAPYENSDSSFDIGRIPFEQQGTHFKIQAVSAATSRAIAIISSLIFHYNRAAIKG